MNIWGNKEALASLERVRKEKRQSRKGTGRLTFDCFNLKYSEDGNRAYCSKGKMIGRATNGSLALITVLRGITSGVCKDCEFFDTEE